VGFYLRLAPGLRLGLTSRGLRASVGPRSARLHFGAGGPGVSTGAGPLTYYQPLSSGSTGRGRAAKLAQAQQVNAMWERLFAVHQQSFPPAQPRPVAAPAAPSLREFTRGQIKRAQEGLPWWRWTQRWRVAAQVRRSSQERWPAHLALLEQQHQQALQDESRRWSDLIANEPATVFAQLQDAFADNDMPAAPVGIEGSEASVAVLAPPPERIPQRIGGLTQAGNVSLRKLRSGERQSLATAITCGYALVTAREAFAVAPGLVSVRVVVVRERTPTSPGEAMVECLLAGRWLGQDLESADWAEANALSLAAKTAEELIMNLRGQALQPIDLREHPDIGRLLDSCDPISLRAEEES